MKKKEELELVLKAKESDEDAKMRLIEKYKGLIDYYVSRYITDRNEREDLYNAGVLGLLKAIDRFIFKKGAKLITFADYWIKFSILKAVQQGAFGMNGIEMNKLSKPEPEFNEDSMKTIEGLLDARTYDILKLRYGIGCRPHTLEEVGKKYQLSRERIRQIEVEALKKLRDSGFG